MYCENSPCKVEGTLENEEHMMKSDADSHKMDAACTNGMCMGLVFQIKQGEHPCLAGLQCQMDGRQAWRYAGVM